MSRVIPALLTIRVTRLHLYNSLVSIACAASASLTSSTTPRQPELGQCMVYALCAFRLVAVPITHTPAAPCWQQCNLCYVAPVTRATWPDNALAVASSYQ